MKCFFCNTVIPDFKEQGGMITVDTKAPAVAMYCCQSCRQKQHDIDHTDTGPTMYTSQLMCMTRLHYE